MGVSISGSAVEVDKPNAEFSLPFRSFFIAGFECAAHCPFEGPRLDLLASTRHDQFALLDYRRLKRRGIHTARDGIRWHLIEKRAGHYDFSSVLPMLRAAQETSMQIIWDLCHYGWPDGLDIWNPAFIKRYAGFARAFARLLREESGQVPLLVPINEPSYLAWAGGEIAYLNPCEFGRGAELKRQLVRAEIEGIEAVWSVQPKARFVHTDPLINVVSRGSNGSDAKCFHEAQYEARDMLTGRMAPELGGAEKYLDIVGLNYYSFNQWFFSGERNITSELLTHRYPQYQKLRDLLAQIHARYSRPLLISETGAESWKRAGWLRAVADEVRAAIHNGIPVHGLCWYPILDNRGWDDGRYCSHGLWGDADEQGRRNINRALSKEIFRQGMYQNPIKPSEGLCNPKPASA